MFYKRRTRSCYQAIHHGGDDLTSTITQSFANAGLVMHELTKPIGRVGGANAAEIFQMTIRHDRKRGSKQRVEYFEMFPGGSDNDVRVLDACKERQQVILSVHEPRRKFIEKRWDREKKEEILVTRESPDFRRAYLVGMDETHLFIARLPRIVSSIDEAHRVLKPVEIRNDKRTKIRRQGEWFFIPVTPEEDRDIYETPPGSINKKFPIGGVTSRAHVAAELIRIENVEYVRGKITHPDHATRDLKKWHRVMRNAEVTDRDTRIGWID